MTSGCVTTTSVLSGGNATGLAYTPGAAGTAYYVTVVAQASSGYLASGTSGVAGPQNATSQLALPDRADDGALGHDERRDHGHVHRLERRRPGELHRDGLHERRDDDRLHDVPERDLRRPAHRAHPGTRATTRRSRRSRARRPTCRRPPPRPVRRWPRPSLDRPDRRLPRLRHGRRLDRGHLHRVVQRGGRPDLHGQGLHRRRHDDGRASPTPTSPRARTSRVSPTSRATPGPPTT